MWTAILKEICYVKNWGGPVCIFEAISKDNHRWQLNWVWNNNCDKELEGRNQKSFKEQKMDFLGTLANTGLIALWQTQFHGHLECPATPQTQHVQSQTHTLPFPLRDSLVAAAECRAFAPGDIPSLLHLFISRHWNYMVSLSCPGWACTFECPECWDYR